MLISLIMSRTLENKVEACLVMRYDEHHTVSEMPTCLYSVNDEYIEGRFMMSIYTGVMILSTSVITDHEHI